MMVRWSLSEVLRMGGGRALRIISSPEQQPRTLESWALSSEGRTVSGPFGESLGWHLTLFLPSKVSCKSGAILGFQLVEILDF